MSLMARILPIVIGDFIPEADPYWENYLVIIRIADLLFANKLHEDAVGYMANLIHLHHTRFKQLYPGESIIPKMHFMVHMPRMTLQ